MNDSQQNSAKANEPAVHADIPAAIQELQHAAPTTISVEELYSQMKLTATDVLFRRGTATHTLPPTALVHEFLLWIRKNGFTSDPSRNIPFATELGRKIRDVLRNYDRLNSRHHASRHSSRVNPLQGYDDGSNSGGPLPIELRDHTDELALTIPCVRELDELLKQLEAVDAQAAAALNLRYFADMTNAEIAQKLGLKDPDSVTAACKRGLQWMRDNAG